MSSTNIATYVPILSGAANYKRWKDMMHSFLLSQDLTEVLMGGMPSEERKQRRLDRQERYRAAYAAEQTAAQASAAEASISAAGVSIAPPVSVTREPDSDFEIDDEHYTQMDKKVRGFILLRVSEPIFDIISEMERAIQMWEHLAIEYGTNTAATLFGEFKLALETTIPSDQHPGIAIDKIISHLRKLAVEDLIYGVPDFIQAMIILQRLPPSYATAHHIISLHLGLEQVSIAKVKEMIVNHW